MAFITAATQHTGKGKKPKLTDYLLRWGAGEGKGQTAEEQLAIFQGLAERQARQRVDDR